MDYPVVWALHVGVFMVWFPTIWFLKKDEDYKQFLQSGLLSRSNPVTAFRIMLRHAPVYLKVVAMAGLVYAPVNVLFFINSFPEAVNTTRMFSGHWIAFYGMALGVLYPFRRPVVL